MQKVRGKTRRGKGYFYPLQLNFVWLCACACLWLMVSNPPSPIPLHCFSLMSQGWLIWPWAAALARQERELPRLRAPLNWICKTKKKERQNPPPPTTFEQPDRHLSYPNPPTLPLSSFIQSKPLLICFPWWEEIYQDAVSLTSLSDWDRNRISKCLTGLRGFIFKPPPPLPSSCTNLCLFKKRGGGDVVGW